MTDTKARRALVSALDAPKRGQTWLAQVLRIRQSAVSNWARGSTRPDAHHRMAIEILLGIPSADWMTAEEARTIARVREVAKAA